MSAGPATWRPAELGPGALGGLRILKVAGTFGAYCGKLFAELGADVILVEPPGGAPLRRAGPLVDDVSGPDGSLIFAYLHGRKRGITLGPGHRRRPGALPPARGVGRGCRGERARRRARRARPRLRRAGRHEPRPRLH